MFAQLFLEEVVFLRQRLQGIKIISAGDEPYFCWLNVEAEPGHLRFGQRVLLPLEGRALQICSDNAVRHLALGLSVSLRETRSEDAALTDTQMTVDTGKTCHAHQLWIQGSTGVCLRLGRTVLRGEAQIGHINLIPMLLKQFSGLMSRWMTSLELINSKRWRSWSASINTVVREKLRHCRGNGGILALRGFPMAALLWSSSQMTHRSGY